MKIRFNLSYDHIMATCHALKFFCSLSEMKWREAFYDMGDWAFPSPTKMIGDKSQDVIRAIIEEGVRECGYPYPKDHEYCYKNELNSLRKKWIALWSETVMYGLPFRGSLVAREIDLSEIEIEIFENALDLSSRVACGQWSEIASLMYCIRNKQTDRPLYSYLFCHSHVVDSYRAKMFKEYERISNGASFGVCSRNIGDYPKMMYDVYKELRFEMGGFGVDEYSPYFAYKKCTPVIELDPVCVLENVESIKQAKDWYNSIIYRYKRKCIYHAYDEYENGEYFGLPMHDKHGWYKKVLPRDTIKMYRSGYFEVISNDGED